MCIRDRAYSGIKELPLAVLPSVTRRMREPNVGSVMIEFVRPSGGAGGIGLASVPVYAGYVVGALAAKSDCPRPSSAMITSVLTAQTGFWYDDLANMVLSLIHIS